MSANIGSGGLFHVVNENEAASITDVSVHPCESSQYIQLRRMRYKQNKTHKTWDYLKVHNSVAILLFNTDKEVFILVRQFRPAVFATSANAYTVGQTVDTAEHVPKDCGFTYECCAGIVDKGLSLEQTAKEEILEETGYDVPLNKINRMMTFRGSVGTSGNTQTMFYAEVTNEMSITQGGGDPHEGESIEVLELPLEEANNFLFDESFNKPAGLIAAFLWYFREKGLSFR